MPNEQKNDSSEIQPIATTTVAPEPGAPPVQKVGTLERPLGVTVVCILSVVASVLLLISFAVADASVMERLQLSPILIIIGVVLLSICVVGMWFMKKWAGYLYLGLMALNALSCVFLEPRNFMGFMVAFLLFQAIARNIKKMT